MNNNKDKNGFFEQFPGTLNTKRLEKHMLWRHNT